MSQPKNEISERLYNQYIVEEPHLNLEPEDLVNISNPLRTKNRYLLDNPHKHLMYIFKQPEYVAAAAKYLFNLEITPQQAAVIYNLSTHSFPFLLCTRGWSKTWVLGFYCMLRGVLEQGIKIACVGAGLRQSRHIFEYASRMWNNSPVLRSLFNVQGNDGQGPKWQQDRFVITMGESKISFLPIGDGEKIRGERASIIIIDELQSQNPEILERVVYGFAAVSRDPIENVKKMAKYRRLKDMGIEADEPELSTNQIILSGTAYYQFNHIYKYFQNHKNKIRQNLGNDAAEHVLIRIPYELVPEGFMETNIIEKVKEGGITGIAEMEFGCVFSRDSDGFYKASIINNAIAKLQNNIHWDSAGNKSIEFYPSMRGAKDKEYVIAIDPASEQDNLSVVVLEVWPDHRRTVYCWTTNKKDHREKFKKQITNVDGYYSYCAQKIRELSKIFNTTNIVIDSQGGGYAIMEAWNEEKNMKTGDIKWWPVIDEEKEKDTDDYQGLHNVTVIQMANAEWVYEANHNLKKDIESRTLLFPYVNPIDYAIESLDKIENGVEVLEDVTIEIEELKSELIIIEHTKTPNGRDKWDLPKVKAAGQVKQHNQLKKDRYSALLMCNAVARTINKEKPHAEFSSYQGIGLSIYDERTPKENERLYVGPSWFADAHNAMWEG